MDTYVDYFRCGEIYKSPSHSNKTPYILKCYECSDIFLLLESFIFHIEDYCKPFKEEKDIITKNLVEPPQEIEKNSYVQDDLIVVKNEPVLDDIDYEENMVVEDSGGGDSNNSTKFSQLLNDGKDDQMANVGSSNQDEGNNDLVDVFEIDHPSDSEDDTFATKNSLVLYSKSDTDNSPEEIIIESESVKEIEEEACVGKRAYKKQKSIPKRLQDKTNRDTSVQPNPCKNKKCQNSCGGKFSESDRLLINEHFWGIGNKIRQKDWLRSCIKRKCVNRRRSDSNKKKYTYDCVINYNDNSLKVCQQFLLKTLHISQQMLITARENSKCLKSCSTIKKRSTPHNKSDESKVALVKGFIEQLQAAVPSH